MKDTVSFFFLGTDCHRSKYEDVLTAFHQAAASSAKETGSKVATHLFDGVGSEPNPTCKDHPTPGRYVYDAVKKIKVKTTNEILSGIKDLMKLVTGRLMGDGMDDLLFEAILYLQQLIAENGGDMPKTVNLHGYSRGADTCVRLANLLDNLYPDVKVNLFLVDHVPGAGRADDPNSYIIPKNVQRLDAAVMLHEYKPGFDPQDRNRYVFASPHTTKVAIKVYPGWHGKAVLLTPEERTNHVPKLLHDDLYRFSQETGSLAMTAPVPPYKVVMNDNWTDFKEREAKVLTAEERFKYYNEMRDCWWLYSKGTALNTRKVLKNHMLYSQDHRLFVNQEHGELFQGLYPNLYQWFYEGKPVVDETELRSELKRMNQDHGEFYKKFCKINKISAIGPLPSPRKVTLYFRRPLGATLVDDERSFLEQAIISVTNYEKHLKETNSEVIKFALDYLHQWLNKTANKDDESATPILKEKIREVILFLKNHDEQKSYLYCQLRKVCHSFEYIDRVSDLLAAHLENNRTLHLEQREYIARLKEELNAIKNDRGLNYIEKMKAAKSKVNSLSLNLQNQNHKEFTYNLFAKSFFITDKYTLPTLLKSLNKLNAPGFSEISLASNIAKKFEAYYLRNIFWNAVHGLLSHIINLPPFFSSKKSILAHHISSELSELNETGHGNDLARISKILAQGQMDLHENYKKERRQSLGEFDKIMIQAHGQLNLEVNAFPFTDVNPEIHQNL
ncbi:Dot/Icm T4SS effector [Legionella steigerwaltii]|uniref:Dot/Icm T4SS effector n=1 Tax=Legionella steigerwaltii TaxID=460 RepID=A0A378LC71_9GAMM|nr:DUF5621 domain-containing protein [Legionella steigerwaltii]KTD78016.1 Dot/Icm T4SS effector [Legionella steigerwaltii]STY24413.1 Dot/Icm T4SS effector [Legionella steigerwaltii]